MISLCLKLSSSKYPVILKLLFSLSTLIVAYSNTYNFLLKVLALPTFCKLFKHLIPIGLTSTSDSSIFLSISILSISSPFVFKEQLYLSWLSNSFLTKKHVALFLSSFYKALKPFLYLIIELKNISW